MCLIAVAWGVHPRYPLALIANRDESHARPTSPAGTYADLPGAFGGRDGLQGGSWLMVSSRGRLAAVTNVRQGLTTETAPRSRGGLVTQFVQDIAPARDWCAALAPDAPDYGRFNLLAWDGESLAFATNHPGFATCPIAPGVFDTPILSRFSDEIKDGLAKGIQPLQVGEASGGMGNALAQLGGSLAGMGGGGGGLGGLLGQCCVHGWGSVVRDVWPAATVESTLEATQINKTAFGESAPSELQEKSVFLHWAQVLCAFRVNHDVCVLVCAVASIRRFHNPGHDCCTHAGSPGQCCPSHPSNQWARHL